MNIKIQPSVSGKFFIYEQNEDGTPNYNKKIAESGNTLQWTGLSELSGMLFGQGPHNSGRYRHEGLASSYLVYSTNGTASNRFNCGPTTITTFNNTLIAAPAGVHSQTSHTFEKVGTTFVGKYYWNITPVAGTYQEIGVVLRKIISGAQTDNYQIPFSRAQIDFTYTGAPVVVVYQFTWDNTPVSNGVFLSNTLGATPNFAVTIEEFMDLAPSYPTANDNLACILNTDAILDESFDGLKTGEAGVVTNNVQVNYKGNGTGTNGLTDATKIQTYQSIGVTFTNLPVATYTSLYINAIPDGGTGTARSVFQKLINLDVTNPVNTYVIYIDYIVE